MIECRLSSPRTEGQPKVRKHRGQGVAAGPVRFPAVHIPHPDLARYDALWPEVCCAEDAAEHDVDDVVERIRLDVSGRGVGAKTNAGRAARRSSLVTTRLTAPSASLPAVVTGSSKSSGDTPWRSTRPDPGSRQAQFRPRPALVATQIRSRVLPFISTGENDYVQSDSVRC